MSLNSLLFTNGCHSFEKRILVKCKEDKQTVQVEAEQGTWRSVHTQI